MAKAEFIDVLNYKDELYVKLTFNRPGRGAPRGKHAINFQVVKAWIGKAPVNGKESSLPDEGDPERNAFKDYLQAINSFILKFWLFTFTFSVLNDSF